ncbi:MULTISPECIES: GNAT family N-acetyltransferase [unclassified Streptomyces]|uniref:GNAT family N-acetyltransferase n=1 Tax=unclassified Streptomyces TaxID=2593676 RepID=UPI00247679A3|nr:MULTISPECIES: GNAT family N-acetyltransferase [unclassified Streptomyces]
MTSGLSDMSVPARFAYWWGNATTPLARLSRRAHDTLPGARVGWDSRSDAGGPTLSYGGVSDGLVHALAPMELWRHQSATGTEGPGVSDVERHGGRRVDPLKWARGSDRGDLLLLGLYADEIPRLDLGRHVVAPLRVHYLVDLGSTPEENMRCFGKKDRENLRRGLRRHGWQLEQASTAADFDLFFDSMHVPTMARRHHGWVRSERRAVAEHALFRRGMLFFLCRSGERVAGVLCKLDGDTLVLRLAGVRDGDPQYYRAGAQMMLYHLVLEWAVTQGIEHAELSGSRPFVSEGLFAFKRRFRPRIVVPDNHFRDKRLVLVPRRDTPQVRDFLRDHPVIAVGERGGLDVLFPYDSRRPPRTDLTWACPGLVQAREMCLDELLADLPSAGASPPTQQSHVPRPAR